MAAKRSWSQSKPKCHIGPQSVWLCPFLFLFLLGRSFEPARPRGIPGGDYPGKHHNPKAHGSDSFENFTSWQLAVR
jgi:hypothetical protein